MHRGRQFLITAAAACALVIAPAGARAQSPEVLLPNLTVRQVAGGLTTPTAMAFLGDNELLVLEKQTGRVQRVVDGEIRGTALDLAVNNASERGLLGIALHPDFPTNPGVYLYWTESATGADTNGLSNTHLLGNRVDRFTWDGTDKTLTYDSTITRLRAPQPRFAPEDRDFGNNNGGVLRFGPDGKLYIFVGDVGRRGQLQNLPCGPVACGQPDDEFGGPAPDDAHLTGVVLRLNDDGTAPADNPFFALGAQLGGEVGANLQKVFSYGHRNSFGMAFDPRSGDLWLQENGDDSFSELNRVTPGQNGGWIQVAGPIARIDEFRATETDQTTVDPVTGGGYFGLQQLRWSPENIAATPEEARLRLFELPGSHYSDPEFSWRFEVAPAAIGFLSGDALGRKYDGTLWMGAGRASLADGYLFLMRLTGNRRAVGVDDRRLEDRVADNRHKFDITESETLLAGRGFGVVPDVRTGPSGQLYVVSLTRGAIYEISHLKR